jgi:hypothetical protein
VSMILYYLFDFPCISVIYPTKERGIKGDCVEFGLIRSVIILW